MLDQAGQQRHRLVYIPPGGRGADTEPGREIGECLALAQAGQHEQGLLAGVQPAPQRPDRGAMPADDPGHEREDLRDNGSAAR